MMWMEDTKRWLTASAAVGALMMSSVGAVAQQAAPAAAGGNNPWVKVCNNDPTSKRDVCLTTQELRADNGQMLASIALREISGEARKVLLLAVPPAMLIQPGLRVQVDKGKQAEAKYSICFANACYAEMVANDAFITSMKKGQQLLVTTLNQQGKPVNFPLGLAGFAAAQEGPAVDTQALARQQQQLQEELAKRAEEARQKLIQEQQKAQDGAQPKQ